MKSDFRTAKTELEKAANDEAPETFVRLALTGDLGEDEIEELRNIAHRRTGINKRTLDNKLKSARQRAASKEARQVAERRTLPRRLRLIDGRTGRVVLAHCANAGSATRSQRRASSRSWSRPRRIRGL